MYATQQAIKNIGQKVLNFNDEHLISGLATLIPLVTVGYLYFLGLIEL